MSGSLKYGTWLSFSWGNSFLHSPSYCIVGLSSFHIHYTMAQATRDAEGFVVGISNIPEDEDFVVYGTIHAHPGCADALEAVYTETTRLAQDEPGTVYYCICRV